jgi:thiamine pyrophosphate-dependent acetolactate synthase large subunit-like protein
VGPYAATTELSKLAKGMGCAAGRVADPEELRDALVQALRAKSATLLEVEIE